MLANTGEHISFQIRVFIFSRYYAHECDCCLIEKAIIFLVSKGNSILFFIVATPIDVPTYSIRGFPFSPYTLFFSFIFISWRLITLQHCSGFCHTLKWISHGFTYSFQHLLLVDFLKNGHSDWYEVVPHCSFDLHFSNN